MLTQGKLHIDYQLPAAVVRVTNGEAVGSEEDFTRMSPSLGGDFITMSQFAGGWLPLHSGLAKGKKNRKAIKTLPFRNNACG